MEITYLISFFIDSRRLSFSKCLVAAFGLLLGLNGGGLLENFLYSGHLVSFGWHLSTFFEHLGALLSLDHVQLTAHAHKNGSLARTEVRQVPVTAHSVRSFCKKNIICLQNQINVLGLGINSTPPKSHCKTWRAMTAKTKTFNFQLCKYV